MRPLIIYYLHPVHSAVSAHTTCHTMHVLSSGSALEHSMHGVVWLSIIRTAYSSILYSALHGPVPTNALVEIVNKRG